MNTEFGYVAGGTLPPSSRAYVERSADRELWDAVCRGDFCYVLTSRQMGKSSLLVRTAIRLRAAGFRVTAVDLTSLGKNLTSEQWYVGLLTRIAEQLQLEDELEEYLAAERGVMGVRGFFGFLSEVVLARDTSPVVVFVDEVDVLRSLPFSADEFLAGIRECHNRRALDDRLQRLTFSLFGVCTPADLIQDARMTPFNIGTRIQLKDFTEREALALVSGLLPKGVEGSRGKELSTQMMKRVLYWTRGHPYLTQRFCVVLAGRLRDKAGKDLRLNPSREVDSVCAETFLTAEAREEDTNLVFVRDYLLRSAPDVAAILYLYQQVLAARLDLRHADNPLMDLLRLAGLVDADRGRFVVRNRIYRRVFDRQWVAKLMPDAETRRQRQAFWTGVVRAAGIGACLVCLMAWASWERIRASKAEEEAAMFFELSTDLFAIANKEGYFTLLNRQWEQLLGYPESELRQRPYLSFVHPDDQKVTGGEAFRLNQGFVVVDFTNRYVHRDGRTVFTLVWRAHMTPSGRVLATARPIATNQLAEPLH